MTFPAIDIASVIVSLEWLFIGYFLLLHGGQTLLTAISMNGLRRRMESVAVRMLPSLSAGYEIPVSIIVPISDADPEATQFIQQLFDLDYPQFEIIVVNDTSDRTTFSQLKSSLQLAVFPEAYWRQVRARQVRGIYRSARFPALRVIDKDNGGLGDALNAGINAARYPVVCIARTDCVLRRDSLRRLVPDLLEDASTVAVGSAERIANGSFVVNGFVERSRLAGNPLVWVQASAALRRDLCARQGWAGSNATLAFSHRFCAFRKEAILQVDGFDREAANPVLELLGRFHRHYRAENKSYRIAFLPAPIVWRFAPTAPGAVCRSNSEEHRGLAEALKANRKLFWQLRAGIVGHLAYPFVRLTETARPIIELLGVGFFVAAYALGLLSGAHLVAFAVCAAGLGILLSWLAILLDAALFRTYQRGSAVAMLLVAAVFENIGYRQFAAICALAGSRHRASDSVGDGGQVPGGRTHQTN